jgi:Family of unknown function (DUF6090)
MFKFFRKIRQKLFTDRKFREYFLYALGEIFLIVIGILIALQINNWNEDKKERKLEDEYLQKIGLNIEEDINKYNQIITAQQTYRSGIDSFLQIIRNPFKYETADLDKYYSHLWRFERFTSNNGALNNLISSGKINIIQNEDLLNEILTYYRTIDEQTRSVDEAISVYSRNQIGPYFMYFDFMNTKVLTTEYRKRKQLLEYHKDPIMENLISARLLMMDIQKSYYNKQIDSAKKLLNQINEELKM